MAKNPKVEEFTDASQSRRIYVLHVIESLAPAGAEQVLVNTLPAIQKTGATCEVAALWPPYDLAAPLRQKGITVHELNLPSTWSILRGVPALRDIITRRGYSVIHAHLPMAVFYSAAAKGPIPLAASFHGLSFEFYPPNSLTRKIRRIAERWWTNHRVDAYIAVSADVALHYNRTLGVPREKFEIIPNGFLLYRNSSDTGCDSTAIRALYGISSKEFLLVTAGRFVKQKGHIYLLRAVEQLVRRGGNVRLLLFGHGPLRAEMDAFLDSQQLRQYVTIHDPLPHPELMNVLRASDLFVFPSVSEGFGMAAGEAMSLGIPVVASDLPGIASLVLDGESGVLIPPADVAALCNAISVLMNDSELRSRLARNARRRIEQTFSVDETARRILSVYRRLLCID